MEFFKENFEYKYILYCFIGYFKVYKEKCRLKKS